ncbi:MAG: dienelactone hydrolase family protein [Planctomycetia bacterium]|nr:dienelactone hydrolase family protein [Planctomycetia bacterium]
MKRKTLPLMFLLMLPLYGLAQAERHELGRRLRNFETTWEQTTDAGLRQQAAEQMNQAVNSFFSLKLMDAGQAMDRGILLLKGNVGNSKLENLTSIWLKPEGVWLDSKDNKLPIKVERFYPLKVSVSDQVQYRAEWLSTSASEMKAIPGGEGKLRIPDKLSLAVPPQSGDYMLRMHWSDGSSSVSIEYFRLSISENRDERLRLINQLVMQDKFLQDSIDKVSLQLNIRQLNRLAKGEILETDYPAQKWLTECEQVLDKINRNEPFYQSGRMEQHWMGVKTAAKGVVPLRIQTVQPGKDSKVPVVLALHGAGGSENLFFDGYGNGKIARLAAERGWFVVAPRNSFSKPGHDQTLKSLAERYPEMDLTRVFVVGHSMGASEALREASQNPGAFAAVAALGGGGSARPVKDDKKLFHRISFYIGVGEHDFARNNAKNLERQLKQLGIDSVTFNEYKGLEHMIIVQDALPEVFQFFDKVNHSKVNQSETK